MGDAMTMRLAIADYKRGIPPGLPEHELDMTQEGAFKWPLWLAVRKAIDMIGLEQEFLQIEAWPGDCLPAPESAVFMWNGQKAMRQAMRQEFEAADVPVICVEHGWFKRYEYFHFSANGNFGPFAHFKAELASRPVTAAMEARAEKIIAKAWGEVGVHQRTQTIPPERQPQGAALTEKHRRQMLERHTKKQLVEVARQTVLAATFDIDRATKAQLVAALLEAGFGVEPDAPQGTPKPEPVQDNRPVLVVLQVAGDAQTRGGDGEYTPGDYAQRTVRLLRQAGVRRPITVRVHPGYPPLVEPGGIDDTGKALPNKVDPLAQALSRLEGVSYHEGRTVALAAALAECAYVVTYNSNTVHEAMVAGVPCLVTGPHLADQAGVLMQVLSTAGPAGFKAAIETMEEGWAPEPAGVRDYLARLCDRQWSLDEIRESGRIRQLLDELQELRHGQLQPVRR